MADGKRSTLEPAAADLVIQHWRWAEKVGRTMARQTRTDDPDDNAGDAMIALIESAQRYKPDIGVPFVAFARRRIVGAIQDSRRQRDTAGRSQRNAINAGRETAWTRRGGPPERLDKDISDVSSACVFADQEELVAASEVFALVRELPPPFKEVLERHYFRGERMCDIGASMGVTESRVCQLAAEGRDLLQALAEVGT